MRLSIKVYAHWLGWCYRRIPFYRPAFSVAHQKRQPPVVPGYWLPYYDHDANGEVYLDFGCARVGAVWTGNLRNAPRKLKGVGSVYEQAKVYLGRSVDEELGSLALESVSVEKRQTDLLFGRNGKEAEA